MKKRALFFVLISVIIGVIAFITTKIIRKKVSAPKECYDEEVHCI